MEEASASAYGSAEIEISVNEETIAISFDYSNFNSQDVQTDIVLHHDS